MGPAKITNKYSKRDKLTVAYHETGHAITGLELKDGMQVQKITIIPRRNAGGYVSYSENEDEDRFITKRRLEETLITLMAGRASEELFVGEITTGAHNDFERATHIARAMITKYGMTELGKYQYESDDPNHVYRVKQYSNESAEAIDKKINEILDIAYNKAKEILTKRSDDVHLLAKTIQEVETLGKEEIDYLMEHRVLPESVETEKYTDAEIKKVKKDHDKAVVKAQKEAQAFKDMQTGRIKVVTKKVPVKKPTAKKPTVKKTTTKKATPKKVVKKDDNEKTDSK